MCEELFPDAVQILDYYHMVENVNNFAKYLHPGNEVKAKGWGKQVIAGGNSYLIIKQISPSYK